jgi:hypothetical protein
MKNREAGVERHTLQMERHEKSKHAAVERRTREQVEAMLASGEAAKIVPGLSSAAYYDPDWRWVQAQCLFYLTNGDNSVRIAAASCLGLLAVFHKKLDADLVLAALRKAAENPEVRAQAEESIDDIQHTLGLP